jgi:IclR family acetate operon transcriptional repressor
MFAGSPGRLTHAHVGSATTGSPSRRTTRGTAARDQRPFLNANRNGKSEGQDMSGNGEAGRSVISKLSAILLTFTEGGSLSLTEIARRSGLPTSTVHRLVNDLAAWRLLERDQERRFRPGLSLRALGATECWTTTSIRDLASPVMEDLGRAAGSETRFGVLHGDMLRYIYKTAPDVPVSEFSPAATLPLHATALGKVLMAFTEPAFIDQVLSRDLRAYTSNTITDRPRLRWTLKLVKAHRFAVSDRELVSDYCGIAAPIFGSTGRFVGALEVRVADVATVAQIERPMLSVAAASLSRDLYRGCCSTQPDAARTIEARRMNAFSSAAARPPNLAILPDNPGRHPSGVIALSNPR